MPKEKELDLVDEIEMDEIKCEDEAEEIGFIEVKEVLDNVEPLEIKVPLKDKKKPIYTYEAVHGEKSIRKKFKDGVFQNYEVTIVYKRKEVFDETFWK